MSEHLCILVCDSIASEARAVAAEQGLDELVLATFPARCGRPPLHWQELSGAAGDSDQVHLLGGCSADA